MTLPDTEKSKWSVYYGQNIKFHAPDWSASYTTKLVGFDSTNDHVMIVEALPVAPSEDWIVSLANYDETSEDGLVKAIHGFWTPQLQVVTGISQTSFTVSAPDASKLFTGGFIRVHSSDYSVDSGIKPIKILSVVGVTVTVETSLGFTPSAGQKIDLVGFVSDSGKPYAWA